MATETKNTKAIYNTEIPSDWEEMNINEMFYFKQGVQCAVDNQFEICNESRVRFIRIIDLTDSNEPIRYIDHPGKEHHVLPDDLFMIRYGTPGVLGYGYEGVIANNLFRIIPKTETNNNHFFYYQLTFKERQIQKLSSSSTMPALNFESLSQLKVLVPPLSEQKAIAKVLSTADAAIQTTEKLITQKELHKKWLMQQLLTGKKRFKGFSGDWKEKKLSDLFERVTRKNEEGNTNVVTISAQRGFVKQNDFFNKTVASETLDNYFLVQRGEFCYNKSYSNGYPWGATKRLNTFDKAVVTTLYICFGIKDENNSNSDFFEQYFEANLLDKGLTKIAHEGGRAHGLLNVTPSDFFSLKFMTPSFEEQIAIAQVLQVADKEISLLKAKAEKLREQKKGLMQQLLTGKKRIIKNR